jgi:hypothetical protein
MVSRDSTEAELIGLSDKIHEVEWCYEFLEDLGIHLKSSIVYQDNTSTLELIEGTSNNKYRSKHLRARRASLHEKFELGEVKYTYCPTELMVADANTKAVDTEKFHFCAGRMLGVMTLKD